MIDRAFTLLELLVAISLLSFVSALTMIQGIGNYQAAITALHEGERTMLRKAHEGAEYRYIRAHSSTYD